MIIFLCKDTKKNETLIRLAFFKKKSYLCKKLCVYYEALYYFTNTCIIFGLRLFGVVCI